MTQQTRARPVGRALPGPPSAHRDWSIIQSMAMKVGSAKTHTHAYTHTHRHIQADTHTYTHLHILPLLQHWLSLSLTPSIFPDSSRHFVSIPRTCRAPFFPTPVTPLSGSRSSDLMPNWIFIFHKCRHLKHSRVSSLWVIGNPVGAPFALPPRHLLISSAEHVFTFCGQLSLRILALNYLRCCRLRH